MFQIRFMERKEDLGKDTKGLIHEVLGKNRKTLDFWLDSCGIGRKHTSMNRIEVTLATKSTIEIRLLFLARVVRQGKVYQ